MDCEQSSDEAKNSFVGDYLSLALLDIFPCTFPVPIPTPGYGGVVHQIIWHSWSERTSKNNPISFFSVTFKNSYRKQVNKKTSRF